MSAGYVATAKIGTRAESAFASQQSSESYRGYRKMLRGRFTLLLSYIALSLCAPERYKARGPGQ